MEETDGWLTASHSGKNVITFACLSLQGAVSLAGHGRMTS